MEQYILALVIVKIKDPIISWTQFPDVFFQMFGDIDWQIGAVFDEKVDVEDNLVVLDTGILVSPAGLPENPRLLIRHAGSHKIQSCTS